MTDLLQVADHLILVAFEYTAEELYDLLVIEVVDAFYDAWQEQLHREVKISVELICHKEKKCFRATFSSRDQASNKSTHLRPSPSSGTFQ